MTVLTVRDLKIEVGDPPADIVADVNFSVQSGEILGLVGESGSGKTTAALAILGHTRPGVRIVRGQVRIGDLSVLDLDGTALRALRGKTVSYVPQDPSAALNPALRVGVQLEELLVAHDYGGTADERGTHLETLLQEVSLSGIQSILRRYPHQLSGGQQQRILLAMAFACRPSVIVLDEPTTGLDVTTQAHVLQTLRGLCAAHGVAALYVSHDLAVVGSLADRVAVMYAGRIVEQGSQSLLVRSSAHPYTRGLVRSIPEVTGEHAIEGMAGRAPGPGERPNGCSFAPRCGFATQTCTQTFPPVTQITPGHEVRCFRADEVLSRATRERASVEPRSATGSTERLLDVRNLDARYGDQQVVFDIDLSVPPQRCVALVGESGSGKTTLARCIAGIHSDFTGTIELEGESLARSARKRPRATRRRVQYVFQNPYSSLNPRQTIGEIVSKPIRVFFGANRRYAHERVVRTLDDVSLSPSMLARYPHELSGGERQRIAIARALVAEPAVLICDEITSALDVSVQAAMVKLVAELQRDVGVGLLFVTHNLALIRAIADEVVVMHNGRIVEAGNVNDVFETPQDDYTKALMADTPSLNRHLPSELAPQQDRILQGEGRRGG